MLRARFIPLLAGFILGAVALQAQLPGNLSSGGLGPVGGVIGKSPAGGPDGHTGGGRMGMRGHHPRRDRTISGFVDPFWYDDGYYNEPEVIEREVPVPIAPPPPQFVAPEPERIPTAPKMTEIPAAAKAQSPKPLPPAVFVLNSGERIESRHYLLTANNVQLTVERKRRSIPLDALDLSATEAANRQRGLDLHIPSGGSEIVLGF